MAQKSENEPGFMHDPSAFERLGFSRRERIRMFLLDTVAVLMRGTPSDGGVWPSDIEIQRRVNEQGLDPAEFALG